MYLSRKEEESATPRPFQSSERSQFPVLVSLGMDLGFPVILDDGADHVVAKGSQRAASLPR